MKSPIAPNLIGKLDDCYVFWYKKSNQYIVVSEIIKDLLEVFFKTANKSSFLEAVAEQQMSRAKASEFYDELYSLVKEVNANVDETSINIPIPEIPESKFGKHYMFGNTVITINFGSSAIEKLIHPQWAHSETQHTLHTSASFDIFEKEQQLFLFKNNTHFGHYPAKDYHFLQGQIALQLINSFYTKTEADWIATFHASTVCNDEEAIMLIGASGNGKSTLSAVLMAAGIDVLADDFTPLSAKNKEVYRYPSGISVKQGAFDMLEKLYPDFGQFPIYTSTSKRVNIKYIPPIKNLDNGFTHLPCKKIVYVKYDPYSESTLHPIGTEKILETLIPESWLSPLATNAELFLEWLKDLQCYELTYSVNTVAVSKIKDLFKQ